MLLAKMTCRESGAGSGGSAVLGSIATCAESACGKRGNCGKCKKCGHRRRKALIAESRRHVHVSCLNCGSNEAQKQVDFYAHRLGRWETVTRRRAETQMHEHWVVQRR